ncbi:hypothetical protein Pst134EA_020929 [Puccinia striiformis f. sp. tritici]|uniref:hypothetical protein n=1 Tax=Puccinia striiformis f. sp. tritici TaxID=168172 RepID=UPI00200784F5|nr:hypothetical protein Pst134EA_020929 [Puccinia striiformis f. sp. tritici]KAH9457029.1 hypothetical protein Pst134EA_020929 [Puccinia striiformis f. sp. tritici]KAI9621894.1 hypothetical protein KEM48_007502 [Puccinia striiformis f. sp. tritici PST-130]
MPNNQVKTTKALPSKKGKAALSKLHPHPEEPNKSPEFIALRDDKLALNKKENKRLGNALTSRLIWFIEANKQETRILDPSQPIDLSNLHVLVTKFINRNSNQIQEESNKRSNHFSNSRPKSSSLVRLESLVRQELLEYSTDGFVMPDLRTAKNLKLLDLWKDEHRCDRSFLERVKLIRIFKEEPD